MMSGTVVALKNGFIISITILMQPHHYNHVFVIRLSPRLS